ncbi:hypothetical protein [Arthrospiribacter ruber]|uniref:Uncharacterized protein n=1 Tax=Arthrospiribacter ruber TaxID=2487934 RepID=A0A951J3M7_9BACT|nr:hypothetical protein [Arthrospiribacter ruber]MBW3469958.1 hypothetical protein [Arthrospiribacter ruber]
MEKFRAFTTMVFPQRFDGKNLHVNIVIIPRNHNPFEAFQVGLSPLQEVPPFAELQPEFSLAFVRGLDDFPLSNASAAQRQPRMVSADIKPSNRKLETIQAIAEIFGVVNISDTGDRLGDVLPLNLSVKKFLPESYRKSFNFTRPAHPNAVTDDSYECALKKEVDEITDYQPKKELSWGKVFAYILKQPLLAEACGMIYESSIELEADEITNGGYLYVEVNNQAWSTVQGLSLEHDDGPLIKRYAARIPKLEEDSPRPVFAPILFPVLYRKSGQTEFEVVPPAPWDALFRESIVYNDGFAKIVHAGQAVSTDILKENPDGIHPQYESGIRLAWDDEQILIWYVRQLIENEADTPGNGKRVDAPLGVAGYKIDVREQIEGAEWENLNKAFYNKGVLALADTLEDKTVELSHQVYPSKKRTLQPNPYWLPMYFANWIGKSLAVEDRDAIEIYKNDRDNKAIIDDEDNPEEKDRSTEKNDVLASPEIHTELRYGRTYQFRIRMADLSGGGPTLEDEPLHAGPSPQTTVSFKRYVAPDTLRIEKPEHVTKLQGKYFNSADLEEQSFNDGQVLRIQRPLMEYPAVVLTGKYQQRGQDPIQMLKDLDFNADDQLVLGIPDPDANTVEIRVEVKTLQMDNQLSQEGNENYIILYTTHRNFSDDYEEGMEVPITFIDVPVLNLGEPANPFLRDDLRKADLDGMQEIVLPKGRHIRLGIRAVADSGAVDDQVYFGMVNEGNHELDSRYGKSLQFMFYKETEVEDNLLIPYKNIPTHQALFLRANEVPLVKGNLKDLLKFHLLNNRTQEVSDIVQRLAMALGLKAKGMTIYAPKGERVVFGVSSRIRHSLSPDGSSVTFASRSELQDHWLGCLSYQVNRDWTWDGLQTTAFSIGKSTAFRRDMIEAAAGSFTPQQILQRKLKEVLGLSISYSSGAPAPIIESHVGDIEFLETASFESLQPNRFGRVERGFTRIVYIDAIEPKSPFRRSASNSNPRLPDELWVDYSIMPQARPGHAQIDKIEAEDLKLPTVLRPSQIPKIVSVGLAFSPYLRSEDYSSTEARRKHLWVEFEEAIESPDDTYFCRVLANSPDQLLSSNNLDQFAAPEESELPISPEFTRVVVPGQSDDMAGLDAMQPMIKASDSDRHYILPLPPGLHSESPEMFGFFTYEFRVGHTHWAEQEDNLWSTAQGRFGKPIRVTGIQHPCPNLLCSVTRDETSLYVSAPFAKAVLKGKNVTAKPPRTSLWSLLYTQVIQADGRDYRNILLSEKMMRHDFEREKAQKAAEIQEKLQAFSFNPVNVSTQPTSFEFKPEIIDIGAFLSLHKNLHPMGTSEYSSLEIADLLKSMGLPEDSPLSVLVVEVFGNITNFSDHLRNMRRGTRGFAGFAGNQWAGEFKSDSHPHENQQPLSSGLGHFRILRTSPLTKVPFVCCPTCENY